MRIFSLDKDAILSRIRAAVLSLVEASPDVEEVRLFGSLARGDAVPGSDADLLVVLSRCELPFIERAPRFTPRGCGIGLDVFAYTRAELARLRETSPRFFGALTDEALVLYQRPAE